MGVAWDVGPASPINILEIGCGTGYTSQVLAAGNPLAQVIGLDYNPAHIADARSMASEAGLDNVRFIEADLAEMATAEIDALPEFDLVTVHGVWSWVADSVRDGIVRLLQRRLKAGGLVMMGYNVMPGAAGTMGLARVARQAMLGGGSAVDRVAAARDSVQRLMAAAPLHLPASGWLRMLTANASSLRSGYLLHEFLTEYWRPSFQSDVAMALSAARCEFLGSATIDENFPAMSLTEAQRAVLDAAPDGAHRELLFDMFVPRAFRRDVYVRGLRRVPSEPLLAATSLVATTCSQDPVKLQTQAGMAELPAPLIDALRDALARGPQTIGALRALPGCTGATLAELAAILVGSNLAAPLWRQPGDANWDADVQTTRRLNTAAARRWAPAGIGSSHYGLATPALGGAVPASAMELAVARMILERGADVRGPEDSDRVIAAVASAQVELPPVVVDEMRGLVQTILRDQLPAWRTLGIC